MCFGLQWKWLLSRLELYLTNFNPKVPLMQTRSRHRCPRVSLVPCSTNYDTILQHGGETINLLQEPAHCISNEGLPVTSYKRHGVKEPQP